MPLNLSNVPLELITLAKKNCALYMSSDSTKTDSLNSLIKDKHWSLPNNHIDFIKIKNHLHNRAKELRTNLNADRNNETLINQIETTRIRSTLLLHLERSLSQLAQSPTLSSTPLSLIQPNESPIKRNQSSSPLTSSLSLFSVISSQPTPPPRDQKKIKSAFNPCSTKSDLKSTENLPLCFFNPQKNKVKIIQQSEMALKQ